MNKESFLLGLFNEKLCYVRVFKPCLNYPLQFVKYFLWTNELVWLYISCSALRLLFFYIVDIFLVTTVFKFAVFPS